jgi:hypothetical protein
MAIKPQIVVHYSHHMGYVDKGDRMANSYSICRGTLKWMKKSFFHLFDLAILNCYILLSSCGGKKISHRDFRFILVRNMLRQAGYEQTIPILTLSILCWLFSIQYTGPTPTQCVTNIILRLIIPLAEIYIYIIKRSV